MEGTFILELTTQVGYQFEHMGAQNRLEVQRSGSQAERSRLSIAVNEDGRMSFRLCPLTLPLPPRSSIDPVNLTAHIRRSCFHLGHQDMGVGMGNK